MAEHGCDISEIKAQSGHKDVKSLIGYIQHTSGRIRDAYDSVFSPPENHDQYNEQIKNSLKKK